MLSDNIDSGSENENTTQEKSVYTNGTVGSGYCDWRVICRCPAEVQ